MTPAGSATGATALASDAVVLDAATLDVGAHDAAPFARVETALRREKHVQAGGLWGSSQSLLLAWIASRAKRALVVITAGEAEAQALRDDLAAFGAHAAWLPSREGASTALRTGEADPLGLRARLEVAQSLAADGARGGRIVVASLLSILQPLPTREQIEREWLGLAAGERLDVDALLARLVAAGYQRTPLVERPGEVSLRGEILDVYPFASELPLRVELFDEEIESLRSFDPLDQRSVATHERVQISLATDTGGVEDGRGAIAADDFAPDTLFVRAEPLRVADRAEGLRLQSSAHAEALRRLDELLAARRLLDVHSLPAGIGFETRTVQALSVGPREARAALTAATLDGTRALVLCNNEGERHRLQAILEDPAPLPHVELKLGSLARGVRVPALGILFVNAPELFGIVGRRPAARQREPHRVRALQSFFELRTGDLVVHAVHGLARFRGLVRMERAGGEEEHLQLEFAEEVSLFVPAARIDLVQRYVGTGSALPQLDRIGSGSFRRRKERVERAIQDLAGELLEVQARRALRTRTPWETDEALWSDLVESFPWTETVDQVTVGREIVGDLASPRPMDRLLCGDVGFGKTELAIRAAFRVVCGGGQVAMLVPTTVLAAQHEATFRARLAGFPITVAALSRHVTGRDERELIERVERGEVDIVIGTHRILSQDVKFKRLGLVIVDEEQRFGVTHKEHFKRLRAEVDLLTLSATPIPRTLHMSLSGLRDISALTVAPEGRQEIETVIGWRDDDALLREALLAEKNRDGQVFFLHNRVHSIKAVAAHLQRLVPECSYAIGHGQMGARELKSVMAGFTSGATDVLVSTTIVESGIDIPSAGTIVIDHADEFGLSELHQLRGRVGRGSVKSHCFLLLERGKPLREEAKQRLKAIEELTRLGAGFAISMKDLELRGAGNLLGPEQSGHIAAIGYDMYCRLLQQTTERVRAGRIVDLEAVVESQETQGVELELGLRAFLPEAWIPDARTRIEILRELSAIHDDAGAARALEGLRDRFGRPPPEAETLVRTFRLAARLEEIGVRRLSWRRDVYLIEFGDRVALERGLRLAPGLLRPIRTGLAHLAIPPAENSPEKALAWFDSLLHGAPSRSNMTPDPIPMSPLAILLLCAAADPVPNEPAWRDLDGVMLIVNGDILTHSQIMVDVSRSFRGRAKPSQTELQTMWGQVRGERLKERLRVQGGQQLGVDDKVIAAQVQDNFERMREREQGVVGLSRFFASRDVSPQEVPERLRDDLLGEMWVAGVTGRGPGPLGRPSVDRWVRPSQLPELYQSALRRPAELAAVGGSPSQVRFQEIQLDASADAGGVDSAQDLARALRTRIEAGEEMSSIVADYSLAKDKNGIGEVDLARLARLFPEVYAFAAQAPVGTLSQPIVSSSKDSSLKERPIVRLIRILERTEARQPDPNDPHVQELLRERAAELDEEERLNRAYSAMLRSSYAWPPELLAPPRPEVPE